MSCNYLYFSLLLINAYAIAHPPSDITAKLLNNDNVEIMIYHNPSNPENHYIKHVRIRQTNGSLFNKGTVLFDQEFMSQTDEDSQDITIPTAAKGKPRKKLRRGSKLIVTAECNRSGPWKKMVTVQ